MNPDAILPDNAGRHAYHGTIVGNIFYHDRIRPDFDIVAYLDIAKNLGPAAYAHIVPEAWAICIVGVANGHLLANPAISANASRGNDRADTMLNNQARTEFAGEDDQSRKRSEEDGDHPHQNLA